MTDTATAVFRINGTLQGPVVDILGQFLPELKALPRDQAYDRTLDDLDLLTRCFQIFRRERPRFRYVLVDERRRPVAEDNVPLSCGRTLAEVIAMVVRTAAKRYFRRKLSPGAARAETLAAEAAPQPAKSASRSPADELYDAIKAYLLHEWQVPLVPAYSEMNPALVRRIGAKILDCREPESLARLIADPDSPVANDNPSAGPATQPTTFAAPFVSPFAPTARAPA
ncbi:MAG: hypothetical protein HY055_07960, partial [Magnetospirillum sp.]|nr:hypothetical protein [Magnetospirillum sp.]